MQAAVALAALDLTPSDEAMMDAGIAFFRPPMDYKAVDWLLLLQEVMRYNESTGHWQCDLKGTMCTRVCTMGRLCPCLWCMCVRVRSAVV